MANNEAAHAKLRAIIDRIGTLPVEIIRQMAPEVRDAFVEDITAHVQRGESPEGEAWPLKQDGERALVGAQNDVTVAVVGTVVLATLRGKFVRHHKGTAKGGVRRQVIPTRKIPVGMTRACERIAAKYFRKVLTGE